MDRLILFDKTYDSESLYDLGRDIEEAIDEQYNPVMLNLPKDRHGFSPGSFEVTIVWENTDVDQ